MKSLKYAIEIALINQASAGLNALLKQFTDLSKLGRVAVVGAIGLVALAISKLTIESVKAAAKLEQYALSFEIMTGSASKARRLLDDLFDFAAKTPFEIDGITESAKMLLAMGIESENVIGTLKILGDVASGLGVPMERLAHNYGQVKAQAKLTGRELMDFAIAGVPLLQELAQNMNKTTGEIRDMLRKGDITFKDVEHAFVTMTSEGGKFYDMMFRQSKTLFGIFSNIKDNLVQIGQLLGTPLLGPLKAFFNGFLNGLVAIKDGLRDMRYEIENKQFSALKTFGNLMYSLVLKAQEANDKASQFGKQTKITSREYRESIAVQTQSVQDWIISLQSETSQLDKTRIITEKSKKERKKYIESLKGSLEDLGKGRAVREMAEDMEYLENNIKDVNDRMGEFFRIEEEVTDDALENFKALHKETLQFGEDYIKLVAKNMTDGTFDMSNAVRSLEAEIRAKLVEGVLLALLDQIVMIVAGFKEIGNISITPPQVNKDIIGSIGGAAGEAIGGVAGNAAGGAAGAIGGATGVAAPLLPWAAIAFFVGGVIDTLFGGNKGRVMAPEEIYSYRESVGFETGKGISLPGRPASEEDQPRAETGRGIPRSSGRSIPDEGMVNDRGRPINVTLEIDKWKLAEIMVNTTAAGQARGRF